MPKKHRKIIHHTHHRAPEKKINRWPIFAIFGAVLVIAAGLTVWLTLPKTTVSVPEVLPKIKIETTALTYKIGDSISATLSIDPGTKLLTSMEANIAYDPAILNVGNSDVTAGDAGSLATVEVADGMIKIIIKNTEGLKIAGTMATINMRASAEGAAKLDLATQLFEKGSTKAIGGAETTGIELTITP